MKINFKNSLILFLFASIFQFSFAQKKQENMGTETVNVVKIYTPTILDASKIKEIPTIDEVENSKKLPVNYTIFSIPVASTFTPSKGKAEAIEKDKKEHLYDNYASFGGGNYGILNAQLFVTKDLENNQYLSGVFSHISSQGGIKNVRLDNRFYDTSLDLTYGARQNDLSWKLDLGYQNQIYNWYGLPAEYENSLTASNYDLLIKGIHPQQMYNTIYAAGKIDFNNGFLKDVNVKFNHFSDDIGSAENRFYAKPSIKFDVMGNTFKTDLVLDFLSGSFQKSYFTSLNEPLKYGFKNIGISPSFEFLKNDWKLNFGASLFYSQDNNTSTSKIYLYPKINASYKVVGDLMIFFAGAEGNLEQNSYQDFVSQNPFLSPTLSIIPSDQQLSLFSGLKGKLTNNVSYSIQGSYINERNKALFKSNDFSVNNSIEAYTYGNSMKVVYDAMQTLRFYGELKADFSKNITFGINGTFNQYSNSNEFQAWNLPKVKINTTFDFNITDKWFAGATVFYVGERFDDHSNVDLIYIVAPAPKATTLNSYFDANARVSYKHSDRLTAYLKGNNLTNQAYQRWMNFPVQGFQIVLGANYKFDF